MANQMQCQGQNQHMDLERNEEGIGLAKAKKLLWLQEDQSLLIRTKAAAKPREEHRAYFCTLNRLQILALGCASKKEKKKRNIYLFSWFWARALETLEFPHKTVFLLSVRSAFRFMLTR